jgi:hypothetical protein
VLPIAAPHACTPYKWLRHLLGRRGEFLRTASHRNGALAAAEKASALSTEKRRGRNASSSTSSAEKYSCAAAMLGIALAGLNLMLTPPPPPLCARLAAALTQAPTAQAHTWPLLPVLLPPLEAPACHLAAATRCGGAVWRGAMPGKSRDPARGCQPRCAACHIPRQRAHYLISDANSAPVFCLPSSVLRCLLLSQPLTALPNQILPAARGLYGPQLIWFLF